MKIAISTDKNFVSSHFGRCLQFTIVNIVDGKVQNKVVIDNPGHGPGLLPQFCADKGIDWIIAGGMGFRAQNAFVQFGIKTILGVTGDVDSVIKRVLDGTLEGSESLCDQASGEHKECERHHDDK